MGDNPPHSLCVCVRADTGFGLFTNLPRYPGPRMLRTERAESWLIVRKEDDRDKEPRVIPDDGSCDNKSVFMFLIPDSAHGPRRGQWDKPTLRRVLCKFNFCQWCLHRSHVDRLTLTLCSIQTLSCRAYFYPSFCKLGKIFGMLIKYPAGFCFQFISDWRVSLTSHVRPGQHFIND